MYSLFTRLAAVLLSTALLTACTKPDTTPAEPVLNTVSTLAGNGSAGWMDGTGVAAAFNQPQGITLDAQGVLYVADGRNHCIRKVTSSGQVSTLAGSEMRGYADGPAATAGFGSPTGIARDDQGNVYVSEYFANSIRKISPQGTVSTFAGDPRAAAGSQDGPGATARFSGPNGLAIDKQNNLYVAESFGHRIRKISPSGIVSTLAGGEAGFADGMGAAAKFRNPTHLALDEQGTLYVSDVDNNRIRKVTPAGVVSTWAGSGMPGHADGPAGAAQFLGPHGLVVTATGVVYVAEYGNDCIRRIDPDGQVSTLTGSVTTNGYQDGPVSEARFNGPIGIACTAKRDILYVTDRDNHYLRKISHR